jgi:nucleotide-binding universal stress UspA family protein
MSIFAKILLATDSSDSSETAVRTALYRSKRLDSETHIVNVAPEHPYIHAYYDLRHHEEEGRSQREDLTIAPDLGAELSHLAVEAVLVLICVGEVVALVCWLTER